MNGPSLGAHPLPVFLSSCDGLASTTQVPQGFQGWMPHQFRLIVGGPKFPGGETGISSAWGLGIHVQYVFQKEAVEFRRMGLPSQAHGYSPRGVGESGALPYISSLDLPRGCRPAFGLELVGLRDQEIQVVAGGILEADFDQL